MEDQEVEQDHCDSSAENSTPEEGDRNAEVSQGPPMSKRQRKKLEQKLKRKEYLKEKRQQERIRKKQRLKEARATGVDVGPSRKALKHNTMEKSQCKIKVVIDCSFDGLMSEKDIKSIVTQINHCYACNRRVTDPLQFHITDFHGQLKAAMDSIGHYHRWDVKTHSSSYMDVFDKADIIYLSSDSKNILQTLNDDKVYIIGGLVDHNHHKGICLKLAEERGLEHAQLPIGDYVALESRKTLAVNHVFEILLQYTESRDWKEAFYKVIPRRKVVQTDGQEANQKKQSAPDTIDQKTTKSDESHKSASSNSFVSECAKPSSDCEESDVQTDDAVKPVTEMTVSSDHDEEVENQETDVLDGNDISNTIIEQTGTQS